MTSKNYGLLRPFDLEAAKRGETLCAKGGGGEWKYVAGPDSRGNFCLLTLGGTFVSGNGCSESSLRMEPLAWVEGKPVYKGDVLYNEVSGDKRTISGASETRLFADELHRNVGALASDLTWNPPKVKREGWINVYPSTTAVCGFVGGSGTIYQAESDALAACRGHNTAATIRIEWEQEQ